MDRYMQWEEGHELVAVVTPEWGIHFLLMMRGVSVLIVQTPGTAITTRILGKRQWALRQRELRVPRKGGRQEGE
jgi:hypothetical protein